jgi:hypothetical protein
VGLTIAAQLIAMHQGRIDLESAGPDQGCTLAVRLPLAPPPAEAVAITAAGGEHATLPGPGVPAPRQQGEMRRSRLIAQCGLEFPGTVGDRYDPCAGFRPKSGKEAIRAS